MARDVLYTNELLYSHLVDVVVSGNSVVVVVVSSIVEVVVAA